MNDGANGGNLQHWPPQGVGGEDPGCATWPELREAGSILMMGISLAVERDAALL